MTKLKFGKGNAKLDKTIYTFSLPAGWTCPGANICKSKVKVVDGKRSIHDGPQTQFRCFAASQEVLFTGVYNSRQHNRELLKGMTVGGMRLLINKSLPKKAEVVRVHVSGDFYSRSYFDAWMQVANDNPDRLFYAYTKSLNYWTDYTKHNRVPHNFVLTASVGGRFDDLIDVHDLRYAKVVYTEAEANVLGLPIDHDDSHAYKHGPSFALLLHGVQPKGSEASKALVKLKKAGKGGYKKKVANA
jgi:hypothetical protein